MPKFVKLLTDITLEGWTASAGITVELPDKSADALVAEGNAEFASTDEEPPTGPVDASNGNSGTSTADGVKDDPEAELERVARALDDQYKRDELAEAAKKAEVEFPYDAKKGEIIDAVIAQGKANAVLK